MALVFSERFNVGLNGFSGVQKANPNRVAGNPADESFCVFNHASDPPVKVWHVNGPLGR